MVYLGGLDRYWESLGVFYITWVYSKPFRLVTAEDPFNFSHDVSSYAMIMDGWTFIPIHTDMCERTGKDLLEA